MILNFKQLNNIYYAMRHGQSLANIERIIVSDPAIGTVAYGLSSVGREQVMASAGQFLGCNRLAAQCRIVSSDFLRARETAQLLAAVLQCAVPVVTDPSLRERYFGELDGLGDQHYQQVWDMDADDPGHRHWDVESVVSVRERVASLVSDLESQYLGEQLILVAHGDVLQIAQTLFSGLSGQQHRSLPHLQVAELRCLNHSV